MRFGALKASLVILALGTGACAAPSTGEGRGDASSNVIVVQDFPVGPFGSPPPDDDDIGGALMSLVDEQPSRWGGVYYDGDWLVIAFVGQTREEALGTVAERVGSVPFVEVRAASVSVSDLRRTRDVVISVLRDGPGFVSVGLSYAGAAVLTEVTGDAAEAANLLRGKVPGPVRVLVRGGAQPATLAFAPGPRS